MSPEGPVTVSAIVLTYNHEGTIEQALDSVLAQELEGRFEIIVSEDCSTDGTRAIVEAYAQRHPDVITLLLSERNRNDQEVFARAYRAAQGEFVTYLDGDDYWLPGKLERQVAFMREHPECPLSFHRVQVERPSEVPGETDWRHPRRWVTKAELLLANPISALTMCFRRALLPTLPDWFLQEHVTDRPLALLLAGHGDIGYIDEPLAVYREHPGGYWSGAGEVQQRRWAVEFLERTEQHLRTEDPADHARALLRARLELAAALGQAGERRAGGRLAATAVAATLRHRLLTPRRRAMVVREAAAPFARRGARRLLSAARRGRSSPAPR